MNSTSEAIHFGVPMICLPLGKAIDQPLIAYRVADELGLGIRLNPHKMDTDTLTNAISRVLVDRSYAERALVYKEISRKYDGIGNTVNLIGQMLNEV